MFDWQSSFFTTIGCHKKPPQKNSQVFSAVEQTSEKYECTLTLINNT